MRKKGLKFLNRNGDTVHQILERAVILLKTWPSGAETPVVPYITLENDSMDDLTIVSSDSATIYQAVKFTFIFIGMLLMGAFSACGYTNGQMTLGTTSYLEQAQTGKLLLTREQLRGLQQERRIIRGAQ